MVSKANIEMVISANPKDLGGFKVRRALPYMKKRMVGPFIFFDHMGPVDLAIGNGMDVRPHPHIGLSTLTYLFEGEIVHKDTLGVEQTIRPGAVNWMTAGSGIAHSERSSAAARTRPQRIHGLQIWIALPKDSEEVPSTFHHHSQADIPELSQGESILRVVAGQYDNHKSPVEIYSDLIYLDLHLFKGQRLELPHFQMELGLYIVSGTVKVGETLLKEGDLGVLEMDKDILIEPQTDARAVLLGGKPFEEPRHIWWNFVSSSKERIEKAKQDWVQGRFGKISGETEFIPLPQN